MKTISVYIILLLVWTSLACTNRPTDRIETIAVSHQDSINKFIEWLFKVDTTIKFGYYRDGKHEKMTQSEMLLSNDYIDSDISVKNYIVSLADTAFIRQQWINRNKFIVPQSLNSFMRILPIKAIEGNPNFRNYYKKISLPLFSKDYKTVYIEIHNICKPTCGYGQLCIFTKDNSNTWTLTKENVIWEN